jgi:hypothetical protein
MAHCLRRVFGDIPAIRCSPQVLSIPAPAVELAA